jgi:hypothetical protein
VNVWTDRSESPWRMGEAMRTVRLEAGVNRLMMRVENGPGQCFWSVLLCPPEVAQLAQPVR